MRGLAQRLQLLLLFMSAAAKKDEGNKAFKEGRYEDSLKCYEKAIDLDPREPAYYANKAMCHIKLEQFGAAIAAATSAIFIDEKYAKCYYRRATALCGLSDYKKAIPDFVKVTELVPTDAVARQKLTECRKMARALAFQRAIQQENPPSIFESLDLDTMPDDDGLGPFEPTVEFAHKLVKHFRDGKKVSRRKIYEIVKRTSEAFRAEPVLTEIDPGAQFTVCGDTHGQFFDLCNLFDTYGWPSEDHGYLFNGDFVDRGSWSTEIALTLYTFKLALPNRFYLNRGNHETDRMNMTYGFSGECSAKYTSEKVFKGFSESFANLPIAALIAGKYLVVHGGLPGHDGVTLDDIRKIDRSQQQQPRNEGLMCELLWADPQPEPGWAPSKRGVGHMFGPDVTKRFCDNNNLKAVIRSHEVRQGGYEVEHDGRLITVFSAPNYCDSVGNRGAVINIGPDEEMHFETFAAVKHPDIPAMAYASGLMR